ncbi:TRAP transporter small permease [Pseudaestuariivita sp.]|uniref:TRAP transporter small permease n=1 Tax=Pseudaestuariivita sp. TaxID=2211669 RepID=UPI0040589476
MHKAMMTLAQVMAILGGLLLTALILLVCLSILGREMNGVLHWFEAGWSERLLELGVGPINGDFELVESGVAFAIFAFLPLCQITGGHATVDVFTSRLPAPVLRWLKAVIEVVFAAVLIVIAWRLSDGMMSKRQYGETTFLLQFPIWWAYAASLAGASAAALVGTYMAAVRLAEAATGRDIVPEEGSEA